MRVFFISTLLSILWVYPVKATVYEFGNNGQIQVHAAVDYLAKQRHRAAVKRNIFRTPMTSNKKYDVLIQKASEQFKVSPALIHAVILNESSYNPTAISPKGAMGLMQLMPAIAKHYKVENAFIPEQNIFGGTAFLKDLLELYENDLELVLAAYNAGETAVNKYNGIPPYPETEQYVVKVLASVE